MNQTAGSAPTLADKMEAIHRMRQSIAVLDETYKNLGDLFKTSQPSDRPDIAAEMANVNEEETAESLFLNHLQAATTEVRPPSNSSGQALDEALSKLQEMKSATGELQKVLQLASAIVTAVAGNRVEISTRTT